MPCWSGFHAEQSIDALTPSSCAVRPVLQVCEEQHAAPKYHQSLNGVGEIRGSLPQAMTGALQPNSASTTSSQHLQESSCPHPACARHSMCHPSRASVRMRLMAAVFEGPMGRCVPSFKRCRLHRKACSLPCQGQALLLGNNHLGLHEQAQMPLHTVCRPVASGDLSL